MADALRLIRWKIFLTWRLYTRNALASLETILFFVVFGVWCIGSYVAIYWTANWILAIEGTPRALVYADIFTFVFVLWIIMSLAGYRLNEGYDLDRLRIYPIPLRSIFAATILGPMVDLSVLLPLSGMLAAFIGSGPSPAQAPGGVLLVLAMVFYTVINGILLVNLLYVFLPRLNVVKVGVAISVVILVWAALLNLGIVKYSIDLFFLMFRPVGLEMISPYPPGQLAITLDAYMLGDYGAMTRPLMGFAAWTAGILAVNYILVAYMWTGDIVSKTGGGRARTADPGTRLLDYVGRLLNPLVGRQAVALYKKDMIEFSLRSPYFLLYKFLPGLIAPMIILLAMRWNLSNIVDYSYISVRDATYGAVGMVLFIMVGQGNLFAGNQFGLEDSAIKNLMLMPTPRRYYLLGKNLFLGLLFLLDALVLSILMLLYYPSAYTFFAWFSLMVTLFLLILTIGNFTSTIWPYWMPLDKPSFTLRSTVILGLVNMAATILLAILFAPALAAVYFPHEFGQDWLSYIMMLAAVAYGILIHQFTLKPAVQLLESNEFLVLRRVAEREEL